MGNQNVPCITGGGTCKPVMQLDVLWPESLVLFVTDWHETKMVAVLASQHQLNCSVVFSL